MLEIDAFVYLLFYLSWAWALLLAFFSPISPAYLFLTVFLFLGIWVKFHLYSLFSIPLVEPVGAFDFSLAAWQEVLMVSATAGFGLLASRLAFLYFFRKKKLRTWDPQDRQTIPPLWYLRRRSLLLFVTILSVALLALINLNWAVYQIGMNPKFVLPLKINIMLAWLINWGAALWVAMIFYWELCGKLSRFPLVYFLPIFEAAIGAIGMLSRSSYLFHSGIYVYQFFMSGIAANNKLKVREFLVLVGIFLVTLVVVLGVVQTLRWQAYISPDGSTVATVGTSVANTPSPAIAERMAGIDIGWVRSHVAKLIAQRWVGLEGVMVVQAQPAKGIPLFTEALGESPKLGQNSLYQKMAQSSYGDRAGYTFLTLTGVVAFFYYSGSLSVVFWGMCLTGVLICVPELLARKWLNNPYVLSLAGVATAYTIVQLTFAYLVLVFLVQLWVSLFVLAWVDRIGSRQVIG
ncbi:MAG: hypothetical protein FDZ72_03090 [Betaproteobacteria bacterium]|nr:MAG: hypothetical protein FDZ72_03090 [Betaproteobacteria bacterium]